MTTEDIRDKARDMLSAYDDGRANERARLLIALEDFTEHTHSRLFCILPCTTDIPKDAIRFFIRKQRELK